MLLQVTHPSTQFVEYGIYITVNIAIFTLIATSFAIAIAKISSLINRVAAVEQQNQGDLTNIDDLWDAIKENRNKMDTLEQQRGKDVLLFTEAIGKLNVTLGKIEVTLENSNNVMEKIEKRIEGQDKQIDELKQKVK